MNTQMIIRIDESLKNKLQKCALQEGKNTSQVLRELMENYIKERDISYYVDDLWNRIGAKLKKNKKTTRDIAKAISQSRKSTKK